MTAVVIGCGVCGLSAGIRLLEADISTEIWTREPASETTSWVAAAFWYPYKAYPEDLVSGWAATTYAELSRLAGLCDTGVRLREAIEVFPRPAPDPWWAPAVSALRRAERADLPYDRVDGYVFPTPVAEMPMYLSYLQERFIGLGGQVHARSIDSLAEAAEGYDIIVNCTGLGARKLVGDVTLTPIRGQVVRVSQVGLDRVLLDLHNPAGLTHIVPRTTDCILGGTVEDSDNLEPDEATTEQILARCVAREPRLARATVLEQRVGLRPGRPGVRVEVGTELLTTFPQATLIHNYGHGGAGVSLSWGCADRVVELAAGVGRR